MWHPSVLRAGSGAHFYAQLVHKVGWELMKNYVPSDSQVFLADSGSTRNGALSTSLAKRIANCCAPDIHRERSEDGNVHDVDESFLDRNKLRLFEQVPLKKTQYDAADLGAAGGIVLIVGSDLSKHSLEARKLAFESGGERLIVPTACDAVELKTAIVTSIILFEIKRQRTSTNFVSME